jgi:hypothetical protein
MTSRIDIMTDETKTDATENPAADAGALEQFDIRHLSPEQLARLGVAQIAYVRPVIVNGTAAFAIHAADGTPIMLTDSREAARSNAWSNELQAVSVH